MKKFIFTILLIIIVSILFLIIRVNNKIQIDIKLNEVDINTTYKIGDFIIKIKNGELLNKSSEVSFDSLGEKEVTLLCSDKDGNKLNYIINVDVVDKEAPVIDAKDKITITEGEKVNLLNNVKVKDNSLEEIKPEIDGKYDINKKGSYKLKYTAKDSSGNISEFPFTLIVKEKKKKETKNNNKISNYYIKVNKTQNVVMVYKLDSNNKYTILARTFICSAGNNTPLGDYAIDAKAETLALEGGVYGHYTMRFLKSRGMWFHSVPYFTKPNNGHWDNLEYEEYNKLGSLASLGCIRLRVIDAKWLYNNIPKGTKVTIYESDTLPEGVVKPTYKKIDVTSPNRGWDPTDPDPENPWKK